jgi:hypothetical protein
VNKNIGNENIVVVSRHSSSMNAACFLLPSQGGRQVRRHALVHETSPVFSSRLAQKLNIPICEYAYTDVMNELTIRRQDPRENPKS